ncbi:MAG: alpha/beta fold hydrolase [Ilumatobacteraceae bacterium]
MAAPEQIRIDVGDTQLGAIRWPCAHAAATVVAIHGITANAWSWAPVARQLDGVVCLVAVDLRGRGTSSDAPSPFGIRRHADDVAEVIEHLGVGPAVVAGHSMGAYVALMAAERHPAAVGGLVLVDGGTALPLPEGVDVQEVLDQTLGPSLARLRQTWPNRMAYRAMWEQHPAFAGGITPEIERYVLADLVETERGFHSSVSEEAVRFDGGELLTDGEVRTAFDRRQEPVRIIRAELGLLAAPPPLIPVEYEAQYAQHDWTTVTGTNHYDVLIGEAGASAVADALTAAVSARS